MNKQSLVGYWWGLTPLLALPFLANQHLPKLLWLTIGLLVGCILLAIESKNSSWKLRLVPLVDLPALVLCGLVFVNSIIFWQMDTLYCLSYWLIFFLIYWISNQKIIATLFPTLIASAVVASLIGITEYFLLENPGGYLLHSATFGNVNFAASFLVVVFPLLLLYLPRFPLRIVLCSLPLLVYLVLTGTRAAWLAWGGAMLFFVILLFILALWHRQKKWLKLATGLLLVILTTITITFWSQPQWWGRLASIGNWEHSSNQVRLLLWDSSWQMWQQGVVGWGNFSYYYPQFRHPLEYQLSGGRLVSHPHNTWLKILVEGGMLALLVFVLWWLTSFLRFLQQSWQKPEQAFSNICLMASLLAFVINSLFADPWLVPPTALVIMAVMSQARAQPPQAISLTIKHPLLYHISLALVSLLLLAGSWQFCAAHFYLHQGRNNLRDNNLVHACKNFYMSYQCLAQAEALLEEGRCLLAQGKTQQAQQRLEKCLEQNPFLENTYWNLGITYIREGQNQKAIEIWQRGVQIFPASVVGHYNLAKVYLDQKQGQPALYHLREVAELRPQKQNEFDYLVNLARCYELNGKLKNALLKYNQAEKINDRQAITALGIGRVMMQLELWEAALHHFERSLLHPQASREDKVRACIYTAKAWQRLQQPQYATTYYLKALQLNPNSYPARWELANIFYQQGKNTLAKRFCLDLQQRFPNKTQVLVLLMKVYGKENQVAKLEKSLRKLAKKGWKNWREIQKIKEVAKVFPPEHVIWQELQARD